MDTEGLSPSQITFDNTKAAFVPCWTMADYQTTVHGSIKTDPEILKTDGVGGTF